MTDQIVSIGSVRKSHGVRGDVLVSTQIIDDSVIEKLGYIYIADPDGSFTRRYNITWLRQVHQGLILHLESVDDKNASDALKRLDVGIPMEHLPELPADRYYHYQLTGITVKTVQGEVVGTIREVMETGANDVYVVERGDGRDVLIPAIKSIVQEIDLEAQIIIIDPMENMLELK